MTDATDRPTDRPTDHQRPLAIDLFCGLGGWTEGLLAEGYRVIGFDIERHVYGDHRYPAQLVLQDVLTIHGSQFKGSALIVASPPCQAYSYRAMPWSRAKALPPPDNSLFEACFRIQREASEAAGRYIPLVVENVCGAQKWVGRARWHFGSFYLWGDVPALMPMTRRKVIKVPMMSWYPPDHPKHVKGLAFNGYADRYVKNQEVCKNLGEKSSGHLNIRNGHAHTKHLTNPAEHADGVKFSQTGEAWFNGKPRDKMLGEKGPAAYGSKSTARKMASAMIAKIPLILARHIAATYYPCASGDVTPASAEALAETGS